jgi:hypothetical protein
MSDVAGTSNSTGKGEKKNEKHDELGYSGGGLGRVERLRYGPHRDAHR